MKVEIDLREKEVIIAFFTTSKTSQYIKVWYQYGKAIYIIKTNFNDVKIQYKSKGAIKKCD